MTELHARAFDLPGWPCPPRVRDIPGHEGSWGWVPTFKLSGHHSVAIDDLGYLWVNGDTVPRFRAPNEADANPGALLAWTPDGIGLWVHPKSMSSLASVSRLDMIPGEWLPVARVLAEMPGSSQVAA
jgi:hypothetical protein